MSIIDNGAIVLALLDYLWGIEIQVLIDGKVFPYEGC